MLTSTSSLPRAAAAIVSAALIAACGSGSHAAAGHRAAADHGASATVSLNGHRMTIAQANRDMLRFAGCMRTHGVEGLPNPVAAPSAFKHSLASASRTFRVALTTCGHLLPSPPSGGRRTGRSRQQLDAMLAFARCMRSHGFARFPDPTSAGELSHEMLAQAGIDLHQPALKRTADGCVPVTHGLITPAGVARFINGS